MRTYHPHFDRQDFAINYTRYSFAIALIIVAFGFSRKPQHGHNTEVVSVALLHVGRDTRQRESETARMGKLIDRLRNNNLMRSASVLVGGAAFAQAIGLLTLPLLTRLYTPNDFGVLAQYSGLLAISSVVACLRYEIAIPIPKKDSDAMNLLIVSLALAASVSIVIAITIVSLPQQISALLGRPGITTYLWFLPIGVALVSAYNALQSWALRKKQYTLIASTRISQALGGSASQLALGALGYAPSGLIAGQIVNSGAGTFRLLWKELRENRGMLRHVSRTGLLKTAREYGRYPRYSFLESFANSAAVQLPVLIIAAAVSREAGFLALAMRVMQAPLGLIGSAVGQVYLSHVADQYRLGCLGEFTANVVGALIKTGVGPLILGGMLAPDVFSIVFGEEWRRAGLLATWMTPWLVFHYLSSPVSMALHTTNNQKLAMRLQILALFMRTGVVLLFAHAHSARTPEAYAVSGLIFHFVYLMAVLRVSGCRMRLQLWRLAKELRYTLPWVAIGAVTKCTIWSLSIRPGQ